MRRHMKAAAAASILFLAAGTGAAQAQNPLFDQESYLAGWRVMAAIGRVDVEVTGATISGRTTTETLTIKWVLHNVDASIADLGLTRLIPRRAHLSFDFAPAGVGVRRLCGAGI